jgi:hypothetical protein
MVCREIVSWDISLSRLLELLHSSGYIRRQQGLFILYQVIGKSGWTDETHIGHMIMTTSRQ